MPAVVGWLSSAEVRATAVPDAAVSHGQRECPAVELLSNSPGIEAPGHPPRRPASLPKRGFYSGELGKRYRLASRGPNCGGTRGITCCITLVPSPSYAEIVTDRGMESVTRYPVSPICIFPLRCVHINQSACVVAQLPQGRAKRMCSPTNLLIADHLYRFVCEGQASIRFGDLFHPVFNRNGRGAFEEISCRSKRTRSPNLNMCYMD